MKTFAFAMRQNGARWLLLYGVLAGLFFSSGEGIQLMPFPVLEGKTSKIAASREEENSKSYAFSVFSSRSAFTLLKSKFQKDPNQYLSGASVTFEAAEDSANFYLSPAQDNRESIVLRNSLVPNSRSKRAPPVI